MNRFFTTGLLIGAMALTALGQDWYHDRDERFRRQDWHLHLFAHVRTDLDHVWEGRAADRERARIEKTKEELTKMQADLDHTRWDNGILNDVIDSLTKTANDQRLSPRDREVMADDVRRLKEFQDQHNHPPH
jgi:hypothetical protein